MRPDEPRVSTEHSSSRRARWPKMTAWFLSGGASHGGPRGGCTQQFLVPSGSAFRCWPTEKPWRKSQKTTQKTICRSGPNQSVFHVYKYGNKIICLKFTKKHTNKVKPYNFISVFMNMKTLRFGPDLRIDILFSLRKRFYST